MTSKTVALSKKSANQLQLMRLAALALLLGSLFVAHRLQNPSVVMVRVDGVEKESHIVARGPACHETVDNGEFEKLVRDLPIRGYLAPK